MITKKQKQVLDYIRTYEHKHGYGPSLEELADHFGKALSTVHRHIEILKEKGLLRKLVHHSRSIGVYKEGDLITEIPLMGYIAAGEPIEAIENPEPIKVSTHLLCGNGPHYALQIKGDSMMQEGILDGDIVVINQKNDPQNGDIVVADVGTGVTLKKFYLDRDRIELRPRNPTLQSQFFNFGEVEVRGIFCGLIRKS